MAENFKYSAEATFRGFRAQTLYILNRIINDTENLNYRVEGHEDLDICSDEDIKELVQVKSYSNDLRLSDFEPEKDSSFFRRSVDRFKDGLNPETIIVSFGRIGPELENGFMSEGTERASIRRKLREKGYEDSEIDSIFENIKIRKEDEEDLEQEIFNYLKENHAGFDPEVTFDLLMNWIYQLSEISAVVKKEDLVERLNSIVYFLSQLSTFLEEYGVSVKQLELPEEMQSYERLEKEFYAGSHTRYEHIIADLDVKRHDKLDKIKEKFELNNVCIIHGASGQGKSTLAYRFLHEHYPNSLTYQIKSKERDALRIINTLNAISKSIDDKIAIFIDVEPNDNVWFEIVKEIHLYPKFNILVTIREEDWKRSNLSSADLIYSEIKLSLNKEEAEEIYNKLILKIPERHFLDFEEAWSKFGYAGPLLEFVYLITHGQTLRDRLEQQVDRIRKETVDLGEINGLDFLRLVSIISMYGSKTNLELIIPIIPLRDPVNTIRLFQEEYLIREESNGKYIGALHPIRSKILVEILSDPSLKPIKRDIGLCLSVINEEDIKLFLLNCFVDFGPDDEILKNINEYKPISWIGCGLIIESLLWLGVKNYLDKNSDVINEAYNKFHNAWIALIPDISNSKNGKLQDIVKEPSFNIEFREEIRNLRSKLSNRSLIYEFLNEWLINFVTPSKVLETELELQNFGLSLFWISRLNINKEISFSDYEFDTYFDSFSLNCIADFILGLYYFDSENDIIEYYKPKIVERIKKEFLVPLIEDDGEKITLHCIMDIVEAMNVSKANTNYLSELIMDRFNLIRKIYPKRKIFSSKVYGNNFPLLGINFEYKEQELPIEELPLDWLIDINVIFYKLASYDFSPDTWDEYINSIVQNRVDSLELIKNLINNLKLFFRKSGTVDILKLNSLSQKWDSLFSNIKYKKLPKSSVDILEFNKELDKEKENNFNNLNSRFDRYNDAYTEFTFYFLNFLFEGRNVIILQSLSKGKSHEEILDIKKKLRERGIIDFNEAAIVNLQYAYKFLLNFQLEFKNLFGKYVQYYNLDDLEKEEKHYYGLLTELWRIFTVYSYKKDKKIIKKANNQFQNEKKNVVSDVIKVLENEDLSVKIINKSFTKEKYLVFNISDPVEINKTIRKVINTLKKEYSNVSITDTKRLFLDIEFEYFRIIILVKGKLLIPASYNFPLFRALNGKYTGISIMDLNTQFLEEKDIEELSIKKWDNSIPELIELYKVFKLLELQDLVYHLKQLNDLKLDDYGFEITQNYFYKISEIISKDFQDVLDFLELILAILNKDIYSLMKNNQKYLMDLDKINDLEEKRPLLEHLKNINKEIKEKKEIREFIKEIHNKFNIYKFDNSAKNKILIELEDIDKLYELIQENKENIHLIYLYFAEKLISEDIDSS